MASWQTLLTLDRKAEDFVRLARQLLADERRRKSEIPQFTEVEALELIELMDLVVRLTPYSAVREVEARLIPL